jgi:peroxiredoxin
MAVEWKRRAHVVSDTKPLNVGDPAPDFTLKSIGLKEVSLHDYRGKNVVLLFYPLDWTPG